MFICSNPLLTGREGTMDCKLHRYPKFYKQVILFVGSKTLLDWFGSSIGQTFQPIILIQQRDTFIYHNWVRTLIYHPLSYPFWSLPFTIILSAQFEFCDPNILGIILSISRKWKINIEINCCNFEKRKTNILVDIACLLH